MDSQPDELRRNVTDLHGRAGVAWLARLPDLQREFAARWSLELGAPFAPLNYNYVVAAVRAGGPHVVLKLGFPCKSFVEEVEALRLFDGRGSVRLLEADAGAGAMLLERVRPGATLAALVSEGRDEEATFIAAGVMRELPRPAPSERVFPTAADYAEGLGRMRSKFGGGTGPLRAALVEEAEALFDELLDTSRGDRLLHGDLHHGNVLAAGGGRWLAIDPKGLVAEPEYETGALLRNPLLWLLELPRPREALNRRVKILSETLGFDPARVRGWALAQAVLSVWWGIEDHDEVSEAGLACAELFSSLG